MKFLVFYNGGLPRVLKYTDIRSYLFTVIFIGFSVAVPWSLHQFPLAGATFLPMQFFVFVAGLIFGWRAGIVIGLLSPLISYGVAGMPALSILPQIMIELSVYGLVAGVLIEKFSLGLFCSLLVAMIAGRGALLLFITVQGYFGAVSNPVGPANSTFSVLWATIIQSWPGIVIQLIGVPFVASFMQKRLG